MCLGLDRQIYEIIVSLIAKSIYWQALAVIAASGLIWLLVIWLLLSILLDQQSKPVGLLSVFWGVLTAYIFNALVSVWLWRPRPFFTLDLPSLIDVGAQTKSFPSDHATLAFFLAFLISKRRPQWRWVYALAFLVSLGRVAVGVHYPLDVLAGALVGVSFGYLTVKISDFLFSSTEKSK